MSGLGLNLMFGFPLGLGDVSGGGGAPSLPNTTPEWFWDDFVGTVGTLPAAGTNLTWDRIDGDTANVINDDGQFMFQGDGATSDSTQHKADHDCGTADQYCEFRVVSDTTAGANLGPMLQVGPEADSTADAYVFVYKNQGTSTYRLFRLDAGSFTQIGSTVNETPPTVPFVLRIEKEGSTLRAVVNGTVKVTTTDTTYTDHRRGGIYNQGFNGQPELDNFKFGDLGVDVTAPTTKKIHTADGSGNATITVSGTYVDPATQIEARFNGGAWQVVQESPSSNTFTGTITGVAGTGVVDVRRMDERTIGVAALEVFVGEVFLIAGQSNASGRLTNTQAVTEQETHFMFREGDSEWSYLNDPTDPETTAGSLWPLLSAEVFADQARPCAFITTADTATGLVDGPWDSRSDPQGASYAQSVTSVDDSGVSAVTAVIWWQGEGDVNSESSKADYKTHFENMIADWATDTVITSTTPIFITPLGFKTTGGLSASALRTALDTIREALYELADENTNVHIFPPMADLDLSTGSGGDGVHIQTDADAATVIARMMTTINRHLYGDTNQPLPPEAVSVTLVDTTHIDVEFDQAITSEADYDVFRVLDDSTPVTVSSGVLQGDGVTIRLTLGIAITGTATVWLGSGNDGAGGDSGGGATWPMSDTTPALPAAHMFGVTAT